MADGMTTAPQEEGFEYQGEFYRWTVSDVGKDLMLIDYFTHMPVQEFFEVVDDALERGRAPILMALMATSIRAAHPERSVERISRMVMDIPLGDVAFVGGDEDANVALDIPLAGEAANGDGPNPPAPTTDENTSDQSSDVRSLPQTDPPRQRETFGQASESFSETPD
jgi:hypothetical protein